jgi:flavodoxin/ferredoxin
MKTSLIYFSQTGNTRKVARALGEAFDGEGHDLKSVTLRKARPEDAARADLVGVGTPCFMSRAPKPVLDYLEGLPSLDGRKAMVFATSGGGPGRVLYEMTERLRQKGAEVVGGIIIRGECFHPYPAILGRFPGRPDERDFEEAREFARKVSGHISAGRPGPLPDSRPDARSPGRGFYDFVAKVNTDEANRKLVAGPVVDPEKCNQCEWCANICPAKNISMDPYPCLGDKCLLCFRCYTGCPKKAFSLDMKTGNFLTHMFYNTLFERYLGDVKPGEKFY